MSFIGTLKAEELRVLRTVVKTVAFKHYPDEFCTDREADKLIDSLAPETIGRLMRVGVDHGIVNK